MYWRLAWVTMATSFALATPARAQSKAAADRAFQEGKRLIEAGQIAAACAEFENSLSIRVQLGVRLNLADCYQRLGKLTAARAQFLEAKTAAEQAGDVRIEFIRRRLAGIDQQMPRLTIQLAAGAGLEGVQIQCDGASSLPGSSASRSR